MAVRLRMDWFQPSFVQYVDSETGETEDGYSLHRVDGRWVRTDSSGSVPHFPDECVVSMTATIDSAMGSSGSRVGRKW